MVVVVQTAQANVRSVCTMLQCVDASSNENSTPPNGAPNAAATPAAAPIEMKSRLSLSFRKRRKMR